MPKVCRECEYVVPSLAEQQEAPGVPENCPQCGGVGTVVDEAEPLNEGAQENAAE